MEMKKKIMHALMVWEVPTYDGQHEIIKIGHRQHKQNTPRSGLISTQSLAATTIRLELACCNASVLQAASKDG